MASCIDCLEIKRLEFQIASTDLFVKGIEQEQQNKDTEHELMIQNLTTRMDTMSQEFIDFKKEVKQDIQSVKDDIPEMFNNAVNKLLAKIAKWLIIGIVSFILSIVLIIIIAFSRPYLVNGLEELKQKAQTMEVQVP